MTIKEYSITWTIDIAATDPIDAAKFALSVQRDPNSTATVFAVTNEREETVNVDLAEVT